MPSIKISLNDYTLVLLYEEFDTDIDIDELTKIRYDNLFGEVVTVSALLNRVGLIKAEIESEISLQRHMHEVLIAKRRKAYRSVSTTEGRKITVQELEDKVIIDEKVIKSKEALIEIEKIGEIVNSWYWAIQSKDRKLSVLLKGVTPREFENEIVEGSINSFIIKKVKNHT